MHVTDVANAFVQALTATETFGQILPLGGPKSVSWRTIITTVAAAVGRQKMMIPVPAMGVSAVAAVLDRFESFPVTRDQIQMLLEGNTCGDGAFALLGIEPTPFTADRLKYLAKSEPETCHKSAA